MEWVNNLKQGKKILNKHGIVKGYGAGQTSFMWEARAWLYPLFQDLYGEEDLIVSFDGFCFGGSSSNPLSWVHRDQRVSDNSFKCYQACINLDMHGGTVFVPESNKLDLSDMTVSDRNKDWVKMEGFVGEGDLVRTCGTSQVSVTIWDSRTWHCSWVKPMEERHCLYVSFMPRPKKYLAEKRKRFIIDGETTSHWACKSAKNSQSFWNVSDSDLYVPLDAMGETVALETVDFYPFAY